MNKQIIGVDVSKDTIDYLELGQQQSNCIANTCKALTTWSSSYNVDKTMFVLEPTGTYSDKILSILSEQGFEIRMVNPVKGSNFMKVIGVLHKNDQSCAKALAQMGQSIELPVYQLPNEQMQKRKQIQMSYDALSKQKQQLKNQLHALEQRRYVSTASKQALEVVLDTVELQLVQLEEALTELDDEQTESFMELATSVKGIGQKTARLLLLHTNALEMIPSSKQLLSFLGIVPSSHYSGTSVRRKGRITKRGSTQLRACLYCAAKSAKRYNKACQALYDRLRKKGKPHKVAMMAVIKKLLQQVFAVVKSKTKFDNELYIRLTNS